MNVRTLLKKMTLKEKIGQLMQLSPFFFIPELAQDAAGPIRDLHLDTEKIFSAGSILGVGSPAEMIAVQKRYLEQNRLGIPLLFMADVIHGYKTIFPVPIALGCTWDPEAVRKTARVSAEEAALSGIHLTFSPMADLVRDPRWGRVVESFGESPYLNGVLTSAMVNGYQNGDLSASGNIASCVKHFAGYGASEGGRDYNTVDLSPQALESAYFEGYRKAVEAGCRGVMTAFNLIQGVPCTVNQYLLRDVLRKKWRFSGITISDYDSLSEVLAHGAAEDQKDAAFKGLCAGLDIEMASTCYINQLESLVNSGEIPVHFIDEAVLRVLKLKDELGLFSNPYKGADIEAEKNLFTHEQHRCSALEVAHESAVLLSNDGTLPLKKSMKIALIGPFAESKKTNGPWSWHGWNQDNLSLAEALKKQDCTLVFQKQGQGPEDYDDHDIDEIRRADVVLLSLGEGPELSGEAHSRTDITLPGTQTDLVPFIHALGKKTVVLLSNGRPLVLENILSANAILETWFLGTMASDAIADLLLGNVNPTGHLSMSFPRSVGQIPVYHNALPTGRPNKDELHPEEYVTKYLDCLNSPRFPFGHGLSYSRFSFSDLRLSAPVLLPDDVLVVEIDVTNQGPVDGIATVQLYLRDHAARISRPLKELKGFQRVSLAVGKKATVVFRLTKEDCSYRLANGSLVSDPGWFTVSVGTDSTAPHSAQFQLK